jgi:hypothetical protein
MKRICANCEKMTEQSPSTRMVTTTVKGKKISIQVSGYVCHECGDFIYNVGEVLDTAYIIAGYPELAGYPERVRKKQLHKH